ncbi:MAG TPA: choice-of-anchor tandem repeat NxxGxxAF-containing protein, partial [Methylomirabilota bacterium]|nr:choice-of-anchor tandem repeat NxxGxxAF-containing protein [Methylomirabilota bacterium]
SLPIVAPANSKGQVAFFATLLRAAASEAFFLASPGRTVRVAAEGDAVPGGGTLSGFGRHPVPALNERGDVAFAAAVAGGRTVEGIFVRGPRGLRPVVVTGGAAPGVPSGTMAAVDAPALNDAGDVAFLASVRRGREIVEAIYAVLGGRLVKIVAQGDPAPAGGTFAGFGPPVLNNRRRVAFAAVVEGRAVPGGVFVAEGGAVRMLIGAGSDTPIGGIVARVSERIAQNEAGAVAFTAVLKNAPAEQAILVVEGDRPRSVAALGDAAPGGGTFAHFSLWPALAGDGSVAFAAAVDGSAVQVAAFVAGAGGARRLAALGDALGPDRRLGSFGLYPIVSTSPAGGLTFATAAGAEGGVEGVFFVAPAAR